MPTPALNLRRLRVQHRDRLRRLGLDLRAMREDAGLSQSVVAAAAGVDRSHLSRIEAGATDASVEVLARLGAVLGADLGIRFFQGAGPLLRDHLQVAMTAELLRVTTRGWRAEVEVPVYEPVRGVIDVVLASRTTSESLETEIHSQLRRVEQQVRWQRQKADALARLPATRDRTVSTLLVLRNDAAMRAAVRDASALLSAACPARSADAVAALEGRPPWPGPAIVWMGVERGVARLLDGPPRGVVVGR